MDVTMTLPLYSDHKEYAKTTYNCLCNSVAHAEIECDPKICIPSLVKAYKYAFGTDHPIPSVAWWSKKIYRDYIDVEDHEIDPSWEALFDEIGGL